MPTLRVDPAGFAIEVRAAESLMAAAVRLGYYWPTTCGGEGRCTTCAVEVIDGAERLSPIGRSERAALLEGRGAGALKTGLRLACQALAVGDVIVRKIGVYEVGS